MCICNWAAQKQSRSQTDLSIKKLNQFASTTHGQYTTLYVSKMCIQNIANIFVGFWICACWICAKYTKINVPQIFPLLQYVDCWNYILFNKGEEGNEEYSNYFGKGKKITVPFEHQMMRKKIITSYMYSFVTDACMASYEVKYEWTMRFRWA